VFGEGTAMKTVLVLANESIVRAILRYMMKQYNVIEAATPEEAIICFRDHHDQIDLLLADVTLPTISGTQVALLFRLQNPSLPVILTSDYLVHDWPSQDYTDLERLGSSRMVFLHKPFSAHALSNVVHQLIGSPPPQLARAGA